MIFRYRQVDSSIGFNSNQDSPTSEDAAPTLEYGTPNSKSGTSAAQVLLPPPLLVRPLVDPRYRRTTTNAANATDELIRREALYETLESVLKIIMADENAYPFLAKVPRIQTPDYYNIIHRPMDLGTMYWNLKTGTYFSCKAHFLEELNLIWDNCLIYNKDPVHSNFRSG